jgi:hypothetical protein
MRNEEQETPLTPLAHLNVTWGLGEGPAPGEIHRTASGAAATPRDITNWITEEPKIEPIGLYVQVNRPFSFDGPVTYNLTIEYTEHGRNDRTESISGKADPPAELTVYSWKHNLGNLVQGGTIVLRGSFPYINLNNGQTGVLALQDAWKIRGRNPSKDAVKARLGTIELQVIAYKESVFTFHQFDENGLPLFGKPSGFGVMQLDPPPSKESIWSWKVNVDAAKKLYTQKQKDARAYPARTRKKFPDARDFTAAELKLETYQRYNGGAYWAWDDKKKKWVKSPPNGYADEILRIETNVRAGRFPPGWA